MSSNSADFSITETPDAKRIGGANGFVAQGAAMIISGFNGGTLNGPTGPGYRMPNMTPAPIVRMK
jgi:hypothetical protein